MSLEIGVHGPRKTRPEESWQGNLVYLQSSISEKSVTVDSLWALALGLNFNVETPLQPPTTR
jgi:hypothetical protein